METLPQRKIWISVEISRNLGCTFQQRIYRGHDRPYRGVIGGTLNVAIQPNMNPRKLSIDDWFAEQLWTLDAKNLSAKGGLTVAAQPASFFEHADKARCAPDSYISYCIRPMCFPLITSSANRIVRTASPLSVHFR